MGNKDDIITLTIMLIGALISAVAWLYVLSDKSPDQQEQIQEMVDKAVSQEVDEWRGTTNGLSLLQRIEQLEERYRSLSTTDTWITNEIEVLKHHD